MTARSGMTVVSFRTPKRTYAPPESHLRATRWRILSLIQGWIWVPFLIPFWGIGGGFGVLFTVLIFLAIANFLVQSFRRVVAVRWGSGLQQQSLLFQSPVYQVGLVVVVCRPNQPIAETNAIPQGAQSVAGSQPCFLRHQNTGSMLVAPPVSSLKFSWKLSSIVCLAGRISQKGCYLMSNNQLQNAPKGATGSSKGVVSWITARLITEGPGDTLCHPSGCNAGQSATAGDQQLMTCVSFASDWVNSLAKDCLRGL